MGELETKKEFVAPPPQYSTSAILCQPVNENMIWLQQENNLSKLQKCKVRLQAAIDASTSDSNQEELEDNMVDINNKILQAKYNQSVKVKVPLSNEEKGEWKTIEKAYGEHVLETLAQPTKSICNHHGSVHSAPARQDA
jgi:hypothetical protein